MSLGSWNATAGTPAKNCPGGRTRVLSPWKKDDTEMLVTTGKGWLLSLPGLMAKTSEGI